MSKHSLNALILIFLSLTIMEICLILPLYGQAPTPPKASDKPKPYTENTREDTKGNQPISENFSISGTFKINTKQANQVSSNISDKSNYEATPDWWIRSFTGIIGFAAILQVIALLYQAHWMRRQSKEIERSLTIAKETADATKIQAEITEKEYVLKNRAKIHVRKIIITNLEDPFLAKEFPEGTLDIINAGGTPAEIINIGSWFGIGYGKELPMERPDEAGISNLPKPLEPARLEPGCSGTYPIPDNRYPMSSGAYDSVRRAKSDCTLYAMGYIEYADTAGSSRRTTFFREYRLPKGMIGGHKEDRKFFPMEGYEYEE
jgi:hypothetical protein